MVMLVRLCGYVDCMGIDDMLWKCGCVVLFVIGDMFKENVMLCCCVTFKGVFMGGV